MTSFKIYRNSTRILATLGFLVENYYFVPMGTLSGIIAGFVIVAIWIAREKDRDQ